MLWFHFWLIYKCSGIERVSGVDMLASRPTWIREKIKRKGLTAAVSWCLSQKWQQKWTRTCEDLKGFYPDKLRPTIFLWRQNPPNVKNAAKVKCKHARYWSKSKSHRLIREHINTHDRWHVAFCRWTVATVKFEAKTKKKEKRGCDLFTVS